MKKILLIIGCALLFTGCATKESDVKVVAEPKPEKVEAPVAIEEAPATEMSDDLPSRGGNRYKRHSSHTHTHSSHTHTHRYTKPAARHYSHKASSYKKAYGSKKHSASSKKSSSKKQHTSHSQKSTSKKHKKH